MDKAELKNLIRESINEVENENVDRIIRESFDYDVKKLQEYREQHKELVSEGILTESELEEGFFDTVKNLGKNAMGSVADAWKKAKAQGNEDEANRIAAQMKKSAKAGGKAGKAGGGKTPLQPGDHGYTKAYAKSIGSKVADASGARKGPAAKGGKGGKGAEAQAPAEQPVADKKKTAVQSAAQILKKMQKDDPAGFQKLQQYMADPKALDQLLKNATIQQAGQEAKKEISQEKKPGLFSKITDWMIDNPVKAALGLGAIGAIAGAIAVPGIGAGALLLAAAKAAGIQFAYASSMNQLHRSAGYDPKTMKRLPKTEATDASLEEELDKKIEEINSRNMFKLNENQNVVADIEAQKDMYKNFEIDYSQGATFGNNLLALYGIGKRGRQWLTSFDNDGEPMSKEEIVDTLNKVGLGRLANQIPADYNSDEGFKGTHA